MCLYLALVEELELDRFVILKQVYLLLKTQCKLNSNPIYKAAFILCLGRYKMFCKQRRTYARALEFVSFFSVEEFNKNRTCNILTRGLITPENTREAKCLSKEVRDNLKKYCNYSLEQLTMLCKNHEINPEVSQQVMLWHEQQRIVSNFHFSNKLKHLERAEIKKQRLDSSKDSVQ